MRNEEKIEYWRKVTLKIYPRLLKNDPKITLRNFDNAGDPEDDDFKFFGIEILRVV